LNSRYLIERVIIDYNGFPVLYSNDELIDYAVKYMFSELIGKNVFLIHIDKGVADLIYYYRFFKGDTGHDLIVLTRVSVEDSARIIDALYEYLLENGAIDKIPYWNQLNDLTRLEILLGEATKYISSIDEEYTEKLRKGVNKPIIIDREEYLLKGIIRDDLAKDPSKITTVTGDLFLKALIDNKLFIKTNNLQEQLYGLLMLSEIFGLEEIIPITIMVSSDESLFNILMDKMNSKTVIRLDHSFTYEQVEHPDKSIIKEYIERAINEGEFLDKQIIHELYKSRVSPKHIMNYIKIVLDREVKPEDFLGLYRELKERNINSMVFRRISNYLNNMFKQEYFREKISFKDYLEIISDLKNHGLDYSTLYSYITSYSKHIPEYIDVVCQLYNRRAREEARLIVLNEVIRNFNRLETCQFKMLDRLVREITSSFREKYMMKLLEELGGLIGYLQLINLLKRSGLGRIVKKLIEARPELQQKLSIIKKELIERIRNGEFEYLEEIDRELLALLFSDLGLNELLNSIKEGVLHQSNPNFAKYIDLLFDTCYSINECREKMIELANSYLSNWRIWFRVLDIDDLLRINLIGKVYVHLHGEEVKRLFEDLSDTIFHLITKCLSVKKEKHIDYCKRLFEAYKSIHGVDRESSSILEEHLWSARSKELFGVDTSKISYKNLDKLIMRLEILNNYSDTLHHEIYSLLNSRLKDIIEDYMMDLCRKKPKKFLKYMEKKNLKTILGTYGCRDIAVRVERGCRARI